MAAGALAREESPDSTRQRCRVTPGRGNPRDSATENRPPLSAKVRVKRWGKSPPRPWQQGRHGKPHREQCQIGTAREQSQGCFGPSRSGLAARGRLVTGALDEWLSNRGNPGNRIRLIGPLRVLFPLAADTDLVPEVP